MWLRWVITLSLRFAAHGCFSEGPQGTGPGEIPLTWGFRWLSGTTLLPASPRREGKKQRRAFQCHLVHYHPEYITEYQRELLSAPA